MQFWWISLFPVIFLWILLFSQRKQTAQIIEARSKKAKGDDTMQKFAERYIGKYVLMDTVSTARYDGVIKEVTDNAALLEKDGKEIVVNLDYVVRLREYPTGKNGKRKTIIGD